MAGKQESMPIRTGLAPGGAAEPDDHVADAGDAGSGAPYLGEVDRARPDPPQPHPRNLSGGDGKVAMTLTNTPTEAGVEANDATGGEYWGARRQYERRHAAFPRRCGTVRSDSRGTVLARQLKNSDRFTQW
jgi:hypothetical protein